MSDIVGVSHTTENTAMQKMRSQLGVIMAIPCSGMEPRMNQRLESTATLLYRVRDGDLAARERLCASYLPRLMRWAHGRLPGYARGAVETADLVQSTLLSALGRLDEFEPRHEGAFLAYLREILLNCIRKEIRKTSKGSSWETLDESQPDAQPSPVEQVVGRDALMRYEEALNRLPEKQRESIILRIELGFSH